MFCPILKTKCNKDCVLYTGIAKEEHQLNCQMFNTLFALESVPEVAEILHDFFVLKSRNEKRKREV